MKSDLLPILRKELENSFGRRIVSSRDCLQMVDDIYQKTGNRINANTLRRFFGLVQTSYSASPSTLNILSKYCGFNSIDELESLSSASQSEDSVHKEEILHFLVSLFKNLPPAETYQDVMNTVVHQTIHFLDRNVSLVERFQREVATTPAGQYFYFEKSVNMDKLNSYYGEGLRFYARAKNNNEAKVFTHSVQILRHWLSNNPELLEKNMSALAAVPMTINYPSHILARFVAARLYYANFKGEIPDKILSDAAKYYAAINSRSEIPDSDFDLIVGEALILTNHISEGHEYIRRGISNQSLAKNPGTENLFVFWEKLANNRKNVPAKILTGTTKTNRTHFIITTPLNKKYFNLLSLANDSRSPKNNMAELLKETGFRRLSY